MKPQLVAGSFITGIFFLVLALAAGRSSINRNAAVVMRQDAMLQMKYTGKEPGKAGLATLPEGLVVRVLGNEQRSTLIRLPDGREGLIQSSDIALVE